MVVTYNGTSQSSGSTRSTVDIQDQYSLEYVSATTYKLIVNVQTFENGTSQSATYHAYVLKNGTVAAITVAQGGQNVNLTGSEASEVQFGIFGAFVFQAQLIDNLGTYTETNFFHSNGTSRVTIGANTFTASTYVANNLPETITNCDGSTTNLTAFSLTEGTPTGATYPLAVKAHYTGSTTSGGVTTTTNVYVQVTVVTVVS
jgi:hypothetical protein